MSSKTDGEVSNTEHEVNGRMVGWPLTQKVILLKHQLLAWKQHVYFSCSTWWTGYRHHLSEALHERAGRERSSNFQACSARHPTALSRSVFSCQTRHVLLLRQTIPGSTEPPAVLSSHQFNRNILPPPAIPLASRSFLYEDFLQCLEFHSPCPSTSSRYAPIPHVTICWGGETAWWTT